MTICNETKLFNKYRCSWDGLQIKNESLQNTSKCFYGQMFYLYLRTHKHCQRKIFYYCSQCWSNAWLFKLISPTFFLFWLTWNWPSKYKEKEIYFCSPLLFLKIRIGSNWPHTGKPRGEYESMAHLRKALQMDGRRKVKSSSSCFLVMHCDSRPWLFTLRWPMLSSGGFGRKRTITLLWMKKWSGEQKWKNKREDR